MYKLIGHGLTKGERFEPESQPMALQERGSTCTVTLGPEAPAVGFGDWLLDDEWPEGPIVWRVADIGDDITGETRTIELQHVIKALEDISLFGEVTPATIAGSGATTCTAEQAVTYLLGLQSDWALGGIEYDVSNPYEFDGDTIYDAIESVTDTLEDAEWEYDMSVYPFKLYIRQRDTSASCEMRGGRNLSTLKRKISRSGMYTRLYPIGKNNLHIDGNYVSQNEGTYGRVDRIETDQSRSTKAGLLAWANGLLRRHCEPTVTITISGLELSQETGETLDALRMNRVCRAPLPEYGTTITERIVKLQWRDRKKEPENVTVTLANNSQDVTTIIRKTSKASGKARKGEAKQNYLFEANGENLYYEVFDESGHVHGLLRMTEESFRLAFDNLDTSFRSEMSLTADKFAVILEPIYGQDGETVVDYGIKPAKIEASIGKEGSTVKIDANHIRIGGTGSTINLNDVMTIDGNFTTLKRPIYIGANASDRTTINGNTITATHYKTANGGDIQIYKIDGSGPFTINYASWAALLTGVSVQSGNSNKSFTITDNSGNSYKIEKSGDDLVFTDVTKDVSWTFSKAASGTLSGSWSSTSFPLTISLTQNGTVVDSKSIGFTNASDYYLTVEKNGNPTAFGSSKKLINVPFKIQQHETVQGQDVASDRYTGSLASVDATSVYDNGYDDDHSMYLVRYSSGTYARVTQDIELDEGQSVTLFPAFTMKDGQTIKHENSGITIEATGESVVTEHTIPYAEEMADYGADTSATIQACSTIYVRLQQVSGGNPPSEGSALRYGAVNLQFKNYDNEWITIARIHDSACIADNIRAGVQIFGVSGSLVASGQSVTLQAKSVNPARTVTVVQPDNGYTGLSSVTVNAAPVQTKTVSASATEDVEVTADDGYYGLSKVTVNQISDPYLLSENIKSGVTIFGVQGSVVASGQTVTLQEKSVNPARTATDVTPDSGYTGLSKVTVNAAPVQTKEATVSTTEDVEVTADSGYYGLSKVTVKRIKVQSRTVSPSSSAQTVLPESGYDYLSSVTVNAASGASHNITGFDTTAPASASYNNLTNNASGYSISGNNAYIVVKAVWNCDGVSKEAYSYLQGAPTALYAAGKAAALPDSASWTRSAVSGNSKRWTIKCTISGKTYSKTVETGVATTLSIV